MLNMDKLPAQLDEIVKISGFELGEKIHEGLYYRFAQTRDIVYNGKWQSLPAVLKVYDDPRLRFDGLSQSSFNQQNRSEVLTAPTVYRHQITSPTSGWLIMEKLPEKGQFFQSPLPPAERAEFLKLFLEYRNNFPKKPNRPLSLLEQLPSQEYHCHRINRWFELATKRAADLQSQNQESVIIGSEFLPLYINALDIIRQKFAGREMRWCHGHFTPNQVFKVANKELYYLTDFGHCKMYPEGYELAFIIWSDWIMRADFNLPYKGWREGIGDWLDAIMKSDIARESNLTCSLLNVAILERLLGTVLADIGATDQILREEQEARLNLAYQAIKDFTTLSRVVKKECCC